MTLPMDEDSDASLLDSGQLPRLRSAVAGYDYFISYKRDEAKHYAAALAAELSQRGRHCFLDSRQIASGSEFAQVIRKAVQRSGTLLVLATRTAIEGARPDDDDPDWISKELRWFRQPKFRWFRSGNAVPVVFGDAGVELPWKELRDSHFVQESADALKEGIPTRGVVDRLVTSAQFLRADTRAVAFLATIAVLAVIGASSIAFLRGQWRETRRSAKAIALTAEARAIFDSEPSRVLDALSRAIEAHESSPSVASELAVRSIAAVTPRLMRTINLELRPRSGQLPLVAPSPASDGLALTDGRSLFAVDLANRTSSCLIPATGDESTDRIGTIEVLTIANGNSAVVAGTRCARSRMSLEAFERERDGSWSRKPLAFPDGGESGAPGPWLTDLAFDDEGNWLFAAASDGRLRSWRVDDWVPHGLSDGDEIGSMGDVRVELPHPGDRAILLSNLGLVVFGDRTSRTPSRFPIRGPAVPGGRKLVGDVDSRGMLAVFSDEEGLHLLDLDRMTVEASTGGAGPARLCITPDGTRLVMGVEGLGVRLGTMIGLRKPAAFVQRGPYRPGWMPLRANATPFLLADGHRALVRNGQRLGWDATQVLDVTSGEIEVILPGDTSAGTYECPDGTLASVARTGRVRFWSDLSSRVLRTPPSENEARPNQAFSPAPPVWTRDGRLCWATTANPFVTGGFGEPVLPIVRLVTWKPNEAPIWKSLPGARVVRSMAVPSEDPSRVLLVTDSGLFRWAMDEPTAAPLELTNWKPQVREASTLSADGSTLIVWDGERLRVRRSPDWSVDVDQEFKIEQDRTSPSRSGLRLSSNGHFAVVCGSGRTQLLELSKGLGARVLPLETRLLDASAEFDATGSRLVIWSTPEIDFEGERLDPLSGGSSEIEVWDLATRNLVAEGQLPSRLFRVALTGEQLITVSMADVRTWAIDASGQIALRQILADGGRAFQPVPLPGGARIGLASPSSVRVIELSAERVVEEARAKLSSARPEESARR